MKGNGQNLISLDSLLNKPLITFSGFDYFSLPSANCTYATKYICQKLNSKLLPSNVYDTIFRLKIDNDFDRKLLPLLKNVQELNIENLCSLCDTNWAIYFPNLQILRIIEHYNWEAPIGGCHGFEGRNLTWIFDLKYLSQFWFCSDNLTSFSETFFYKESLKKICVKSSIIRVVAPFTRKDWLEGSYINTDYDIEKNICFLDMRLFTDPCLEYINDNCKWSFELPINGYFKCNYKQIEFSNSVFVEGMMTNGKPDGEWRFYNEYGALRETTNYKNGLEDGVRICYIKGESIYDEDYKIKQIFNNGKLERYTILNNNDDVYRDVVFK